MAFYDDDMCAFEYFITVLYYTFVAEVIVTIKHVVRNDSVVTITHYTTGERRRCDSSQRICSSSSSLKFTDRHRCLVVTACRRRVSSYNFILFMS